MTSADQNAKLGDKKLYICRVIVRKIFGKSRRKDVVTVPESLMKNLSHL